MNPNEQLNELALFAGAGGGILGGKLLGWRTICAVEWEPYPACVLAARQNDGILPPFPIWDDVRTFDGKPWRGRVDVVSGGFPCQDISCAGKGAGIDGERSGMWVEMARIIREVAPRYVFVENSPMLTSRGLGRVLGDLAEMGFNARWGVLGTKDAGGYCKRDRIWLVASSLRERRNPSRQGKVDRQFQSKACRQWDITTDRETHLRLARSRYSSIRVSNDARRLDDVATRMEQLRSIGNGQVPSVAALAWRILSES
jgi:DNA (cytosine-5)-methyltransferase 1